MCQFVFVTLPRGADPSLIQPQLKAYRSEFRYAPGIAPKRLERLFRVGRITQAQCDCGTVVGIGGEELRAEEAGDCNDDQLHNEDLRRKGWSEAKIARWLTQTRANRRYVHAQHHQMCDSREEEARLWAEALRATFFASGEQHVGLFHCELGGTRRPKIDGNEPLPIERLTSELIINAQSNVHYAFS